jgi:hypothetical protein
MDHQQLHYRIYHWGEPDKISKEGLSRTSIAIFVLILPSIITMKVAFPIDS